MRTITFLFSCLLFSVLAIAQHHSLKIGAGPGILPYCLFHPDGPGPGRTPPAPFCPSGQSNFFRKKILVTGAGMAGAAAAQRLVASGFDVTVLEARDRTGGRIHTFSDWGLTNWAPTGFTSPATLTTRWQS